MSDLRKAAEMALEALEEMSIVIDGELWARKINAKTKEALRQALAQPEQEPVAYSDVVSDGGLDPRNAFDTEPPSLEAAVLAEREACARLIEDWDSDMMDPRDGADAIRARGEK